MGSCHGVGCDFSLPRTRDAHTARVCAKATFDRPCPRLWWYSPTTGRTHVGHISAEIHRASVEVEFLRKASDCIFRPERVGELNFQRSIACLHESTVHLDEARVPLCRFRARLWGRRASHLPSLRSREKAADMGFVCYWYPQYVEQLLRVSRAWARKEMQAVVSPGKRAYCRVKQQQRLVVHRLSRVRFLQAAVDKHRKDSRRSKCPTQEKSSARGAQIQLETMSGAHPSSPTRTWPHFNADAQNRPKTRRVVAGRSRDRLACRRGLL